MRKFLLASAATVALVATPAAARDGAGYVGIEGGALFPRDNDADALVEFTTVDTPGTPVIVTPPPSNFTFDDAFGLEYKTGYDLDAIIGYDFGMFRVEGELGYKRASLDEFDFDDDFLADLNFALNRPSAAPDPGAPGLGPILDTEFDLSGRVSVLSGMINGLVDFGDEDGVSFYAGGGLGRARVKMLGDSDSAWAYQLIAGARYAISPTIDIGLKYRYFRTGRLNFFDDTVAAFEGNPDRFVVGAAAPVNVDRTTDALVFADAENKFSSHSLLLSLIFNLGGAPEPLPPPPPPPPPPPAAPATLTCPDGSVILATSSCPLPPPPPPPPPVERGERGW